MRQWCPELSTFLSVSETRVVKEEEGVHGYARRKRESKQSKAWIWIPVGRINGELQNPVGSS
jgi:hypothetical protein